MLVSEQSSVEGQAQPYSRHAQNTKVVRVVAREEHTELSFKNYMLIFLVVIALVCQMQ